MIELRFPPAMAVAVLAVCAVVGFLALLDARGLALEAVLLLVLVEVVVFRVAVTDEGIRVRSVLRGFPRFAWTGLRAVVRSRGLLAELDVAEEVVVWEPTGRRCSFPRSLTGFDALVRELGRRGCLGTASPPPSAAERLVAGGGTAATVGWRLFALGALVGVAVAVGHLVASGVGVVLAALALVLAWLAVAVAADAWLGEDLLRDVAAFGWLGAAVVGGLGLVTVGVETGSAWPAAGGVLVGAAAVAGRVRERRLGS